MADDMAAYLEQTQRAERYQGLIEEAAARLAEGNGPGFAELLSANLVNSAGLETIVGAIEQQMIPFFAGAANFGGQTTVTNTTDAYGNTGLAFYKTLVTQDGEERPFVIYIVEEDGMPVVANLLPGKTYEDMHGGQGPGE